MLADLIEAVPGPLWIVAPTVVALTIFGRYLLFAGGLLAVLWLSRSRIAPRRLQPVPFTAAQLRREAAWSGVTVLVFTAVFITAFVAGQTFDLFRFYQEVDARGWIWFWLSVPIGLLVHDFYFYWTHRLMHVGAIYKVAHAVHHRSTNPSPLAAFAFHPLEAVVEAGGFMVVALLVPMHPIAFAIMALVMMVFNVIGHSGYEFFPQSWRENPVLGWLNTATAHNQHHRTYAYNFGLYTLIWDRLFGTLHPRYAQTFDRAARARIQTDTNRAEAFVVSGQSAEQ